MRDLTDMQRAALELISIQRKGSEVTGRNVANAIGLRHRESGKEGADMRAVINALRRKGYPICANGKGYYYPKDRAEIQEYMESLSGRIQKAQEALDGMKAALPIWESTPEVREPPKQNVIEL